MLNADIIFTQTERYYGRRESYRGCNVELVGVDDVGYDALGDVGRSAGRGLDLHLGGDVGERNRSRRRGEP